MALPLRLFSWDSISAGPGNSRTVVAGIVTEGNVGIGCPLSIACSYFAGLGREKKRMENGAVSPLATVEMGWAR
jgi:hypothetical protein